MLASRGRSKPRTDRRLRKPGNQPRRRGRELPHHRPPAAIILSLGGVALASGSGHGAREIHACVQPAQPGIEGRELSLPIDGRCPDGDKSISWGAKGERGLQGRRGPRGLAGPQGAVGATGPRGEQGSKALKGPKANAAPKAPKASAALKARKGKKAPKAPPGRPGPTASPAMKW
ncbi:MAG: hypothetical protein ACTHK3_05720 [Solirubrobacterales bacterium]